MSYFHVFLNDLKPHIVKCNKVSDMFKLRSVTVITVSIPVIK